MPPKVKVSKEDIINTAVELVRKDGEGAINARNVASSLNCSTQPIFSNFATMDELRSAVISKAEEFFNEYIKREIDSGVYVPYKASGMAYIRFAKDEKELFKLLYMRDRSKEDLLAENELSNRMFQMVKDNTGLDGDKNKLFHLEIWAYVHGIATMFATNYFPLDWELVSAMITDVYQGLKKRYDVEE